MHNVNLHTLYSLSPFLFQVSLRTLPLWFQVLLYPNKLYTPRHLIKACFFFNIALEKTKSNLLYRKFQDVVKLVTIDISVITVRTRPAPTISLDEDKYISEIPNKVKLLTSKFIDLSQREIAKIFANKFQLMNLYKLCHI